MKKFILALSFVFLFTGVIPVLHSEARAGTVVVVVVNSGNGLKSVRSRELSQVFLGKTTEIQGSKFIPMRTKSEGVYKVFRKKVLGMSNKKERTYWLKEVMKGRVSLVKQANGDGDVLDFVNDNSNGIGVVSLRTYENARSSGSRVTALKIDGAGPGAGGYPMN